MIGKNLIYNTKTKTFPYFAHAPGKLEFNPHWHLINQPSKRIYTKPENLTIITFNNGKSHNNKPIGLLEKNLLNHGISDFYVLGKEIKNWKNKCKLQLLSDSLKTIKNEFILVSDSSDVVVLKDLNNIIKDFIKLNCQAIFNGEKRQWPLNITKEIDEFEKTQPLYLNAGLWMAYKRFAETMLDYCLSISSSEDNSEQLFYKMCYYNLYPKILVDAECKLFQGLNRLEINDIKYIKEFN